MKKLARSAVCSAAFLGILLSAVAGQPSAKRGAPPAPQGVTLAIVGATLIDGTGRPPLEDGTILIEGERIVAVGP